MRDNKKSSLISFIIRIFIILLLIVICCVGIEVYHNHITKNKTADNTLDNIKENIVETEGSKQKEKLLITEKIAGTGGGESLWYEDALTYNENGKYGLAGLDGTKYTEAEYDDIKALNYEKGYLIFTKDNKSKVVKLVENGYEDFTDYYDEVGVLGADYDIKDDEEKYLYTNSIYVIGVNNGKREKYYEIKYEEDNIEDTTETDEVQTEKTYIENFEVIGNIEIPKTNCNYPILDVVNKRTLDIAIAKAYGPGLNEVGNNVLYGMNYRNGLFFSNNKDLEEGDLIYITDSTGRKVTYEIYNKYATDANDASYFTRDTEGRREISLQTATDDGMYRIIILAKEKK